MALQKQIVPVNFAGGIDTKTDSKTVIPGKLLELQNGVFQKANRITKRTGYNVLSLAVENSAETIDQGQALGVFNDELNLYTGKKLFTRSDSTASWLYKGPVTSSILEGKPILVNSYEQLNPGVAYNQGLAVYVWEDSRGLGSNSRYSVFDQLTGSVLLSDGELSPLVTSSRPRIFAMGNDFVALYYVLSDTSLRYRRISRTTPSTLGSEVTLVANVGATPNYDAAVINNELFVAYADNVNSTSLFKLSATYVQSATTVVASNASTSLGVWTDVPGNFWVGTHGANNVNYFIYNSVLSVVLAPTLIEVNANVSMGLTGIVNSANSRAAIFYEIDADETYNHYVRGAAVNSSGTIFGVGDYCRSVGLAGKPFALASGDTIYVPLVHESLLQSTYFILSSDDAQLVSSKISPLVAGPLCSNNTLSEVPMMAEDEFLFVGGIKTSLQASSPGNFGLNGVNSTIIRYTSENRFQNTQIGELYIVGGVLQSYDGVQVVEDGFHLFPENVTAEYYNWGGAGLGLAMTPGTYQYSVTYEWTDNLGQIHRSAPSIPITVVGTALTNKAFSSTDVSTGDDTITIAAHGFKTGTLVRFTTTGTLPPPIVVATDYYVIAVDANTIQLATSFASAIAGTAIDITGAGSGSSTVVPNTGQDSVRLTIPTLRLTAKDVQAVVYRTESLGTNFYRSSSFRNVTQNATTVDTVTYTDTMSDAQLISRPFLYTTGGVLENISAPACSLITTYKNRVFIAGLEDPLAFQYSKLRIKGTPVEFSDAFIGRIDPRGGKITALGALDNYVVFFKQSAIFVLSGQGPNDTGTQNDYGDPQLVTTDAGCDNPNSIVETPTGLMFKSAKGIYLLDRSLAVTYLGAEVEGFNDLLITSSQLLPDVNQVRFTTNANVTLVYDYFFGQWSTFTNQTANDSAIWQNKFVFLRPSGEVWVESELYDDGISPITLSMTTAWMSFAGLQAFERVYRMILLGEYKSAHKLKVEIGYDFNESFTQVALIDVDAIFADGGGPLYQFKTHLTKQKCQTIRFRISDDQSAVVGRYGESFNITSLAFEVGAKGTLRKYSSKNSFATV